MGTPMIHPTRRTTGAVRRATLAAALTLSVAACGGADSEEPGAGGFAVATANDPPARSDDEPTDTDGTPPDTSSDPEGIRVVDDPAVDDPARSIAEVSMDDEPDEVTIRVASGSRANVDVSFGRDGSAALAIDNAAGARAVEIDGERWRRLTVRLGGDESHEISLNGDVPEDAEVEVRTSSGADGVGVYGDVLAGATVTLRTGSGDDVVTVSGEVRRGATLSVRTGSGNDFVTFGEGDVEVSTGSGRDTIVSKATRTASGSVIDAGSDDDRIVGLAGSISGGGGSDIFLAVNGDGVDDAEAGEIVVVRDSSGVEDDPSEPEPDAGPVRDDPEPAPAGPGPSSPAPSGVSGLRGLWYVGRIDLLGATGPSGVEQAVLEFDDGAVTTDIDTVVADGRRASRRANPTEWGTSRVSNGTLRYRLDGTSDDVETLFTARTRPARSNERPDGCFGSRRGFGGGGVASIAVNTLCLDERGRFSNDRAVATSTPAGSGSSNSQVTGTYRLDRHAIRLDYDDGKSLDTTFGIYEEGGRIETLLVGERVLNR